MRSPTPSVPNASSRSFWTVILVAVVLFASGPIRAQENDDCLMCHEDPELVGERGGSELSVFVDPSAYTASIHGEFACIDCHMELDGVELPHDEELEPVDCAMCHDDVAEEHQSGPHGKWARDDLSPSAACSSCHTTHAVRSADDPESPVSRAKVNALCTKCHRNAERELAGSPHARVGSTAPAAGCADCHAGHTMAAPTTEQQLVSVCGECHARQARDHSISLHGRAAAAGDEMAPNCISCHGGHGIRRSSDPGAPTATMNIPQLCGTCHHEGTEVSIQHDIPQDRIFENYSQSIHGEGLFMKGLTVTAVCTSCHTSHQILEHTDPRSSIARQNVAKTCTVCHSRIEEVHVKVIEGRLWEEKPHQIPSCVECHQPHEIRSEPLSLMGAANRDCMRCHSDPDLIMESGGDPVSLYVDETAYNQSKHSSVACAQCHTEVNPQLERSCETIVSKVDCAICHAAPTDLYRTSVHGLMAAEGDPDAPTCLDCHSKHATEDHRMPTSPTYPRNVPELCAKCHRQGEPAAQRMESEFFDIVESYVMSIHGKGLVESGLVVSATCTDCHTAHHPHSAEHPDSSVHKDNIAATCGTCHHGIEETFRTSVHWPDSPEMADKLPTCEDCHTSHTISRTDAEGFRFTMMDQCGRCHEDEAHTFFDTYHGKVSRLGSEGAAKCYDCHGTHNILPTDNPESLLSRRNVVETCGQCHPRAHLQFAGYLSHATHHDKDKYPFLFYSFWFMTALLVGTMTFAILHTGAWLWRLLRTKDQWIQHKLAKEERLYQRFSRVHRLMHLVMLVSFFTLALTGMALKFSYMTWAQTLSVVLGGFYTMGILHRIGAIVLIALFAFHISRVFAGKRESGKSWFGYIFDSNSLMFNFTDIKQIFESIRWFFGRGPRPHYGRFTYWEKFDYFAVFWGVFVIGSTGLVLWFPVFFTRFLPGWSVNVATIIHSDEALLAVAFIFTIHFFNTHFRPDKFPMDPVIFTGRVPLEELRHDKPAEYEELMASSSIEEIEAKLVDPVSKTWNKVIRIFGFTALGTGLTLIALIVYAMLFGYR
jgi:cytochrome b subunit of formate dehydrogenase